jgi:ligand-binding SRPBCC domain-containing protein
MNINFQTKVKGNYLQVIKGFDRKLFEALKPKLAAMEILEFTGSQKGDRVHIRFTAPVRAEWISLITEDAVSEQEAFFIDEGHQLPWPLSYWKHKHIVRKIDEEHSLIVDDISFEAGNGLLSVFLYPAIWLGFAPRGKIYRTYFGEATP